MSTESDSPLEERIVAHLSKTLTSISGMSARQSPIGFVPETWRAWLVPSIEDGGAGMAPAVLDAIFTRFPGWIDRAGLQDLAAESDNLTLLIGTLAGGRGRRNARMMPHIVRTLTSPNRDDVLNLTADRAAVADAVGAHRAWTLPGLGEPFFTKWLWAASLRNLTGQRLLVLDSRVRRSLRNLGWDSRDAPGGKSPADHYAAYVEAASRWAEMLSTPPLPVFPEDVECALFAANGPL
jgi:hypothetical protein